MHQLIFWGCLLAAAITFPLVFGWIHFTSDPNDQMVYVTYLFGYPTGRFHLHTFTALLLFHGLDIAAFLVLGGIGLSLWRRMRDEGARAVQTLAMDFWPLILLFAISITGLALTVSQEWLGGSFYDFIAILHAITVIAALLYLPFGKFFHIFQRPAQLGASSISRPGLKTAARFAPAAENATLHACMWKISRKFFRKWGSTIRCLGPSAIGKNFVRPASANQSRLRNCD